MQRNFCKHQESQKVLEKPISTVQDDNEVNCTTGTGTVTAKRNIPFPTQNLCHCISFLGVSFLSPTQSPPSFLDNFPQDQRIPDMSCSDYMQL